MKIWLRILLGVVGGFGMGFGTGFFVHKKLNDIQFEEVTNEDFDKLMEGLPIKDVQGVKKDAGTPGKAVFEPNKGIPEYLTDVDKLRNALQGKTPYIQADDQKKQEYSKAWETVRKYSNEDNADELPTESDDLEKDIDQDFVKDILNEAEDIPDEPEPKKEPYLISLGDFYEERRNYDKITIDWYDEDNVVLDEREEPIADIVSYVGCDMNTLFGKPPTDGDPDSRFVRNDKYQSDYEVIRHHASWKQLNGD